MVATIQQIIGKINPKLYAENSKGLLRDYRSSENIPAEEVIPKPLIEHKLVYDSSSETLEPVYFFILDLINDFGFKTEKLVDNFSSSPGSGYFAELGQRATIMQQQGTNIMANINTVLRSVLNIIYDLKDFRTRLQSYEDLNKGDKTKEAATLSLKQIWLDKVDISKGNSSIKAMALGQAGFNTLLDAFLAAKDVKDAEKIDLNERVKRILLPRIQEFNIWLRQSETELKKRYELERTYLKSQVNNLKLYSRWVKPYLKAAQELESKEGGTNPALVKTFDTVLLELGLLGKLKTKVKDAAAEGRLPDDFRKLKTKRDYYNCILVDFKFRGIPQKATQQQPHYVFGGRAEVSFTAYALNDDELQKINKEFEESDVGDVLRLAEGSISESLEQLQDEINFFLEEESQEKKEKKTGGSNPFLALIGAYNEKPEQKKTQKTDDKPVRPDDWTEKTHIRPLTAETAIETAFTLFDTYKKAHGMVSYT